MAVPTCRVISVPELVPQPDADAIPFNSPVSVTLDPGEQATVSYQPEQRDAEFRLPVVAVSKHPDSSYEVKLDQTNRYGPASVPPTDIDDLTVTFVPALTFKDSLVVIVTNLAASSTTRDYVVQPIGWEPFDSSGGER